MKILILSIIFISACSSKAEIVGYYTFQRTGTISCPRYFISDIEKTNEFIKKNGNKMDYPYIFEIYYQKIVENNKSIDSKPYKIMDVVLDENNIVYFIKYNELGTIFFEDDFESSIDCLHNTLDNNSDYAIGKLNNYIYKILSHGKPLISHKKISTKKFNIIKEKLKNVEKYESAYDEMIKHYIETGETIEFDVTPLEDREIPSDINININRNK